MLVFLHVLSSNVQNTIYYSIIHLYISIYTYLHKSVPKYLGIPTSATGCPPRSTSKFRPCLVPYPLNVDKKIN